MTAIIMKIISAVMSVVVLISGAFPGLFGGKTYINPYGDEVHICSFYYFPEPKVISDYQTFSTLHYGGCLVYGAPEEYDSEFFETKSLVCFSVQEPQENFRVWVKSVSEKGDTLEVEYCVIREEGMYAMLYRTFECEIIIEVSKNIKNVKLIPSEKTVSFDVEKLPLEFPELY